MLAQSRATTLRMCFGIATTHRNSAAMLVRPGPGRCRGAAATARRALPGSSAQHAAGRRSGGFAFSQRQLTVDQHVADAGTELMRLIEARTILDGIRIEHYEVGKLARDQSPALGQ